MNRCETKIIARGGSLIFGQFIALDQAILEGMVEPTTDQNDFYNNLTGQYEQIGLSRFQSEAVWGLEPCGYGVKRIRRSGLAGSQKVLEAEQVVADLRNKKQLIRVDSLERKRKRNIR